VAAVVTMVKVTTAVPADEDSGVEIGVTEAVSPFVFGTSVCTSTHVVVAHVKPLLGFTATFGVAMDDWPAMRSIVVTAPVEGWTVKKGIVPAVPVVRVAVWRVSGTPMVPPFSIVTQVGELLVLAPQPVWKPIVKGVDVSLTTLKTAVKRRPVVGGIERNDVAPTDRRSVSTVSVAGEQAEPPFNTPPIHLARTTVAVEGSIEPVRSASKGRSFV
jgi:hypothetical protein